MSHRSRVYLRVFVLLGLGIAPARVSAQMAPFVVELNNPGPRYVSEPFSVTLKVTLPGGQGTHQDGAASHSISNPRDFLNPVEPDSNPGWTMSGSLAVSGPAAAMGNGIFTRTGDTVQYSQWVSCASPGTASMRFDGEISYTVWELPTIDITGGLQSNSYWVRIPVTLGPATFQCLPAQPINDLANGSTIPKGSAIAHCDPIRLETEYGMFIGRVWKEPGTDPMAIGSAFRIHSEFRLERANEPFLSEKQSVQWLLSGDLWEMAGTGSEPRRVAGGHPWLYVGDQANKVWKSTANFSCVRYDTAQYTHLARFRWPDLKNPAGPLKEATMMCYVPTFWCTHR